MQRRFLVTRQRRLLTKRGFWLGRTVTRWCQAGGMLDLQKFHFFGPGIPGIPPVRYGWAMGNGKIMENPVQVEKAPWLQKGSPWMPGLEGIFLTSSNQKMGVFFFGDIRYPGFVQMQCRCIVFWARTEILIWDTESHKAMHMSTTWHRTCSICFSTLIFRSPMFRNSCILVPNPSATVLLRMNWSTMPPRILKYPRGAWASPSALLASQLIEGSTFGMSRWEEVSRDQVLSGMKCAWRLWASTKAFLSSHFFYLWHFVFETP